MQPEESTFSTQLPDSNTQLQHENPLEQHGLLHYDHRPAGEDVAAGGDASGIEPADQVAGDAAFAAELQRQSEGIRVSPSGSERSVSPAGGVSLSGTFPQAVPPVTATPGRNRVEEYEKAITTPPVAKRRGGPAFEVVKKAREPGDMRSPVAELPNGGCAFRYEKAHVTNTQ